jgi:hypothetical protein
VEINKYGETKQSKSSKMKSLRSALSNHNLLLTTHNLMLLKVKLTLLSKMLLIRATSEEVPKSMSNSMLYTRDKKPNKIKLRKTMNSKETNKNALSSQSSKVQQRNKFNQRVSNSAKISTCKSKLTE